MFTEKAARRLVDAAVKYAKEETNASGIEVSIWLVESATARFANNEMTQHLQSLKGYIAVRALVGGRSAVATGDKYTVASVRKLVDDAVAEAAGLKHDARTYHLLKPDHPLVALPEGLKERFDPRVARITAEDRYQAVEKIVQIARKHDLTAAGVYWPTTSFYAIGNSNGLFRCSYDSMIECSVTMVSETSTGWQKASSWTLDNVNVESLAKIAAQKALNTRRPKAVEPGVWDVVLEPSAVLDLFMFLIGSFTGDSHVEETSVFYNKAGEQVLGENITISDDVYHQLQTGRYFDDEGMTRKAVKLVVNGVFKQPTKSRRAAAYLGGSPTGHGCGLPASEYDYPLNLVIKGGNTSLKKMIASTERGILLPRVWYLRDVDPNTCSVTGMTRDGAMLIENGQLKGGIKNMRFNVSLIDLFKNVTMIGRSILAAGEEGFPAVVPSMKVKNFMFTSRTK